MKRIFTSLAPNMESDDVRLAVRLLIRPWQFYKSDAARRVEQWFSEYTGAAKAAAFTSGRGALYAILRALQLPEGSEVLVQAYTCVAVPGPVIWAGYRPVYVDCDKTLTMSATDLAKKITAKSKVLIIQHTFGVPADMDALLAVARDHGLFVIEDCAHALGSTYRGARLGSLGDAAIFSFGRDKALSSVFGGVATVADEAIGNRLEAVHAASPKSAKAWIAQQLAHLPVLFIAKRTYDFFLIGKLVLELAKRLRIISKAVYPVERSGGRVDALCAQMPAALAQLALTQLAKLERFTAHRIKISGQYAAALDAMSIPYQRNSGGVPLRVAAFAPRAHELIAFMKQYRIELGDWYTTPVAPDGAHYQTIGYQAGSCPVAEQYAQQTFNLPTHIGISPEDVKRITHILTTFNGNAR